MAGETIKGITIAIKGDTTALTAALGDVNKQSRNLQTELKAVDKLLKLDPTNTDLLAQKQKLLGESVETTKEKLNRLRDAQAQVNEQFAKGEINEGQYRAFQREVIKTEEELKKLERTVDTATKRLQDIGKTLETAGEKMTSAGKKMSTYVTAPIVGLGTLAVKSAIDFESAFAGVRKTVDATEEEFAALEKGIRDMALEIPATATEIAGVAEAAGQLGIQNENILDFTRTMIDLGESTNLSSDQAATALARLANITQMPQDQFDRLGSTIVTLGNNLATTEAEIVEMALRLAGTGKQVGMSEAQILALAGSLSSVGIAADAGGSAVSKVMANMQLATEKGGKGLDNFANVAGMSASEFKKAFEDDAAGALISFITGLQNAEDRGISAIKMLDDMGITEVRMRDALLRAAGAGDLFNESIQLGTQAWAENTALTEEAAQRYGTSASQFKILRNIIEEVSRQFGEILLPVIISIAEIIKGFAQNLSEMNPTMKTLILVIAGIAAAIGPLLVVMGMMASGVSSIIALFTAAAPAAGAAGAALGGLAGPIAIAVAAVIGLIAVIADLWKNNEEFRNNVTALWKELTETLKYLWSIFGDDIKAVTKAVFDLVKSIIGTFVNVVTNIIKAFLLLIQGDWKGAFQALVDAVKAFRSGVMEVIDNVIELIIAAFKGLITSMFEIGKNIVRGLWDGIKSMLSWIRDKISGFVSSIVSAAEGFLGISSPSKVFAGIGKNISAGLAMGIKKGAADTQRAVADMIDGLNATARVKVALESTGAGAGGTGSREIVQHIAIHSPTPLSPSETARQVKNASRMLALEW